MKLLGLAIVSTIVRHYLLAIIKQISIKKRCLGDIYLLEGISLSLILIFLLFFFFFWLYVCEW